MKIHVQTLGIPLKLRIRVKASYPMILGMKGYDASKGNTVYFQRGKGTNQQPFVEEEFEFPLPLTPERLTIKLYDVNNPNQKGNIEVIGHPKAVPLDAINNIPMPSAGFRDFLHFADEFCQKAGYLRTKPTPYTAGDKGQYNIFYLNKIVNAEDGTLVDTPARISRVTGNIQINANNFRRYTVPIRMFMLLHERMHYEHNTRSEFEADAFALKTYLSLGFPKTEAVYALTNVLNDNKFNGKRVQQLMDIIYQFQYTNG